MPILSSLGKPGRKAKDVTLRARLLLLILLAAVPTIAIEAYSEAQLRSTRQEEIRQEALRLMRLVTAEQERINASARQLLVGFSEGEEVHSADWTHCSETAKQVLARVEGYVNIGIATADGDLLCSGLPPPPDEDMRRQKFLQGMTPSGNLLLGRYHLGLITGKAVLMVAVPLAQSGGTAPLVAWANIDLQWLARHFADRFNSPNLTLLIADSRGTILVRLPDNAAWAGKPLGDQFSSLLNAPAEGVKDTIGIDGEERIIAYSPLGTEPKGIYVGVGLSKAPFMAPIDRSTLWMAGLSAAVFLLATAAAWLIGDLSIRRPVERLLHAAQAWQTGDFTARAGLPKTGSEINRLGTAFDEMAAAVQVRDETRRSIEDNEKLLLQELQHRSNNLLAIIQSIARGSFSGNSVDEARKAFESRLQALARSNLQLNKSTGAALDFADVVRAELAMFPDRTAVEGRSIAISPQIAQKFTLALHELMTNAMKYGALAGPEGRVAVSWTLQNNGAEPVLKLRWEERGGLPVRPPIKNGFGSLLIKTSFPSAQIFFGHEGLTCEIESPVDHTTGHVKEHM
jgi:two-component sensor histidine kinase